MDYKEQLIQVAYDCVGKLYWYGEFGPDYFDSPGLVYYLYNSVGCMTMYLSANELYTSKDFEDVTIGSLSTGDLIFFGSNNIAEEVGIFLNDEYMVICCDGDYYTRGNKQSAKVSIKKVNPKALNFLQAKRHKYFKELNKGIIDNVVDTENYDNGLISDVTINTPTEYSKLSIEYIIEIFIYNAKDDKEQSIKTNFKELVEFSDNKGYKIIDSQIIRKCLDAIALYQSTYNIEDDDLDILEYKLHCSKEDITCRFTSTSKPYCYELEGNILFMQNNSVVIVQKPKLTSTIHQNNIILSWNYDKNSSYQYTNTIYLNNDKIFDGILKDNNFIYKDTIPGQEYNFKLETSHPNSDTKTFDTTFVCLKETIKEQEFENDFDIDTDDSPKDVDVFSFNILGKIDNQEYPKYKNNLILTTRRTLTSPHYPSNEFDVCLVGEIEKGTEFLYDLEVEILTQENKTMTVKKPMGFFNENLSGTPENMLELTDTDGNVKSVKDIMHDLIIDTLKSINKDTNDSVKPNLDICYDFKNNLPLDVEVKLSKQGSFKQCIKEKSNTDVYMDIQIDNIYNLNIERFLKQMHLYSPNASLDDIVKATCIVADVEKSIINTEV